jgi:Spy/CpxP family protein refolding chaperone
VKDRLQTVFRIQLPVVALGVALALTLGGCAGSGSGNAASGGSGAASSGQDAAAGGAGGGSPANGRHRMAEALATLGLSDDQKAKIRAIMSDARKQSANADPATRRANYRAAMAKVQDVLTPDQRTKLQAKLDEMRKERQAGATPQS